jgi:hypothetical protein
MAYLIDLVCIYVFACFVEGFLAFGEVILSIMSLAIVASSTAQFLVFLLTDHNRSWGFCSMTMMMIMMIVTILMNYLY